MIEEENPVKGEMTQYQEIYVDSFNTAVEKILNDVDCTLTPEQIGSNNVCIVDIDGTILSNDLLKVPFLSHTAIPEIDNLTVKSLIRLRDTFQDSVVIATNRSRNDRYIFNSQKVFKVIDNLIRDVGGKIPVFTNLFKQIPGLTNGDIVKEYLGYVSDTEIDFLQRVLYLEGVVDKTQEQIDELTELKAEVSTNISHFIDLRTSLKNQKKRKARADKLIQYIGKRLSEVDSQEVLPLLDVEDIRVDWPNNMMSIDQLSELGSVIDDSVIDDSVIDDSNIDGSVIDDSNIDGSNIEENVHSKVDDTNPKVVTIYAIEDLSIVSLNRRTFLRYIARELKKQYGIDVRIKNYVIRR